jgi:hypothetical protein
MQRLRRGASERQSGQYALVSQLPWPERYSVAVESVSGSGPNVTYTVATWLHASKAVVIAVERYRSQYPTAPIYDVSVTPLGPAAKSSANGTVDVGQDLHDRLEF